MDSKIQIKINTISREQLYKHFLLCNTSLDSINLHQHVDKLYMYSTIFEAWDANIIAGICNCYLNNYEQGIAYISHIEIHKEYKRMGIGSKILNSVVTIAKSKGFKKLQLEVHKFLHLMNKKNWTRTNILVEFFI